MARSHTRGEKHSPQRNGYTNPDVRFEHKDVSFWSIVKFSTVLIGILIVVIAFIHWYGFYLMQADQPRKITDLPPASVDEERLPPEPRLEGIEDVRKGRVALYPPRAEEYFRGQVRLLKEGDPAREIEPIAEAINALAGRLPVRKDGDPAPRAFTTRLPSKAASGRVETGGDER